MSRMTRTTIILVACALAVGLYAHVRAQTGPVWMALYDGSPDNGEIALNAVTDGDGNVIVTGMAGYHDVWCGGDDCGAEYPFYFQLTIKYSPAGDTLWVRRDDSARADFDWLNQTAPGPAIDRDGNIYLARRTGGFPTVAKYSPSGDVVWTRILPTSSGHGLSTHIAYDDSESIYVVTCQGGATTTIKYSLAGDSVWARAAYLDSIFMAEPHLAVDAGHNVIVAGRSLPLDSGSTSDYVIVKYSPAGDTLWTKRYDGPTNEWDSPKSVAVDGAGDIYVTGQSGDYCATVKYSSNGDSLWARIDDLWLRAMCLDGDDGLIITGNGYSGPLTIKYSTSGDSLWTRRFENLYISQAVAADSDGNIYVAGYGYQIIKYSSSGDTLWIRRADGNRLEVFESGVAKDIAIDAAGHVYVTGAMRRRDGGNDHFLTAYDFLTLKYPNPVGDLDCDGIVSFSDVVLLGNYIDGLIDLTGTCGGGQADVDEDGDIDEDDYNALYDAVSGTNQ